MSTSLPPSPFTGLSSVFSGWHPFVTTPPSPQKQQRNKQITFPGTHFCSEIYSAIHTHFPHGVSYASPVLVSTLPSFLPSFSSFSFCPTSSSSSSTSCSTTTTSLPHPCTRSHCRDVDAQCHLLLCPCSRLSSFSIARIFPRNYPFLIFSHSISFLFTLSLSFKLT